jgi:Putative Flp pilus-assembly TadE/G-like
MLPKSPAKKRRGQAIIIITASLVPIMGLAGLVTDIGYMHFARKSAQKAADAAVLAAASNFYSTIGGSNFNCNSFTWICNSPTPYTCSSGLATATNPLEAGCLYAKRNGFWAWKNDGTPSAQSVAFISGVPPDTPPTAPGVNSGSWWVTVRLTQRVPQLFSAVLGNMSGMIAARATASVNPAMGCVYVLDPIADASYYQNGSTSFLSQCGIYIDSSSASAMQNSGNSIVQASEYDIVGGYDWHGTITPTPNTGVAPFPDPLRGRLPPSPCFATGGCEAAGCPNNSKGVTINADVTLTPGVYCGGIHVKNATVTFASGSYIIVGGGMDTQDSNSHIRTQGDGVYFYNTYDTHNDYGTIQFNANSDVQLYAPRQGTTTPMEERAILIQQDRTCCSSMLTESFQGGASSFFEGIIYMPESLVQFAGNPSLNIAHYTIIIVRRFSVQGTSTMNNDFSGVAGGNPIKFVALVE